MQRQGYLKKKSHFSVILVLVSILQFTESDYLGDIPKDLKFRLSTKVLKFIPEKNSLALCMI
jgi:hypothetical protein